MTTGTGASPAVAGLLLTGGRSSRLGTDKALLRPAGETTPLAQLLADRLCAVAAPVCEVGPGWTRLPRVTDDPGEGPLTAVVAGHRALRALGHEGPVLVLATDVPNVSVAFLGFLAGRAEAASVVPVVGGRPQPLCARWSAEDLDRAEMLVERGERRARRALGPETSYLDESDWAEVASPDELTDVDTPEQAHRLGLVPPGGTGIFGGEGPQAQSPPSEGPQAQSPPSQSP